MLGKLKLSQECRTCVNALWCLPRTALNLYFWLCPCCGWVVVHDWDNATERHFLCANNQLLDKHRIIFSRMAREIIKTLGKKHWVDRKTVYRVFVPNQTPGFALTWCGVCARLTD